MPILHDIPEVLQSAEALRTDGILRLLTGKNGRLEIPNAASPCLIAVLCGQMRLRGPFGVVSVKSGQYMTTDFDTPLVIDVEADKDRAFAAALVPLPTSEIVEIVIALEQSLIEDILAQRLGESHFRDEDLAVFDVLLRLARSAASERSSAFLVKTLRAELIFHVLVGR